MAAGQRGESGSFVVLAVIGMLSAAAGAYYYLRLVVVMYLRPAKEEVTLGGGWPVAVAAGACASLTVFFGLFSSPVSSAARAAAQAALHNSPPQISHVAATVRSLQPSGRALHEIPGRLCTFGGPGEAGSLGSLAADAVSGYTFDGDCGELPVRAVLCG